LTERNLVNDLRSCSAVQNPDIMKKNLFEEVVQMKKKTIVKAESSHISQSSLSISSFKERVFTFLFAKWEVLLIFFLFALLLAKNPYSTRNLIPNLEPYPDSIHYISPALSLLRGEGLYIAREGRHTLANVPPLYSLVLLPAFVFGQDVRSFYIINVLLAFSALFIFWLILHKVFPRKRALHFFLLFLYATHPILYWFPTLAMAESLLLLLTLSAIYILISPLTRRNAVILGILAVSLYATKFSSLPAASIIPLIFTFRLITDREIKQKKQIILAFVGALLISGGIYSVYEYLYRGTNIFTVTFGLLFSVFAPKKIILATTTGTGEGGFFSFQYAAKNLQIYLHWLVGDKMGVLYQRIAILPKYLAIPATVGFLVSLLTKRKLIAFIWMMLVLFTIFLMMTFYAADGRYLMIAVPGLIMGVGLFLSWLEENFKERGKYLSAILLFVFFSIYAITQAPRIKYDVMLNLRHAENPWYYISIRTFDDYLKVHKNEFSKKPVIISALPPYIIDFYAKESLIVLPLSAGQEFKGHQQAAWGDHNYQDLESEYQKYFETGHPVFLTQYGLGNEKYLHTAYAALFQRFTLKKVVAGCFSVCDVYQITGVVKK
jgi:hypothetical protein